MPKLSDYRTTQFAEQQMAPSMLEKIAKMAGQGRDFVDQEYLRPTERKMLELLLGAPAPQAHPPAPPVVYTDPFSGAQTTIAPRR